MSATLVRIQTLVRAGDVEVSQHGALELDADRIMLDGVVGGIYSAVVVEDYPDAERGLPSLFCSSTAAESLFTAFGIFPFKSEGRGPDHRLPGRLHAMIRRLQEAKAMMLSKKSVQFIHEDRFAAEVGVELHYADESWSPTMSLTDAKKLEATRLALRRGDLAEAALDGHVFELTPIAAE